MKSVEVAELVVERAQRLMLLGFEGQPAAEVIKGTARLWAEHLSAYSAARITAAFDAIEKSRPARRNDGGGWPTPGDIVRAMPAYMPPESKPASEDRQIASDPEAAARIKAEAEDAIAKAFRLFGKRDIESDNERIEAERARVRAELDKRGAAA